MMNEKAWLREVFKQMHLLHLLVLITDAGDVVVGYIGAQRGQTFMFINQLVVLEAHCGWGAGKVLIASMEYVLRNLDPKPGYVFLNCIPSKDLVAFYEGVVFVIRHNTY